MSLKIKSLIITDAASTENSGTDISTPVIH